MYFLLFKINRLILNMVSIETILGINNDDKVVSRFLNKNSASWGYFYEKVFVSFLDFAKKCCF